MFESDSAKGKLILIVTSVLFLYYSVWIIGVPFIENDWLKDLLFYPQELALIVPTVIGLTIVGGLILFTVYHMSPYLFNSETKNKVE